MNNIVRDRILKLMNTPEPAQLGPESRPAALAIEIVEKELQQAFLNPDINQQRQELIRSAVYLWHDHLDASHTISQNIHSSDGSFLHGIMHRREPDYWNSKYWFRKVGTHPCFEEIAKAATEILSKDTTGALIKKDLLAGNRWDPFTFVDLCEKFAFRKSIPENLVLRKIQEQEIRILLNHFLAHST